MLRQIIRLTRIIQRITRLKRMIPSLMWEPPDAFCIDYHSNDYALLPTLV